MTTESKTDLSRAIDLFERNIRQNPDDIRDAKLLQHLFLIYSRRCKTKKLPENIDRSVEFMKMAMNIAFDKFMSNKNNYIKKFVEIFRQRYDITKSSKNKNFVINIY